jgi:hypothetical protein
MTRPPLVLLSVGCAIITLGAYVAGGTDVSCTRVEAAMDRQPAVEACVVRTTRWLGRQSTSEQTYRRVTDADHFAGRSSGIFRLVADGTVVAEVGATRSDAALAAARLNQWLDGNDRTPITFDFSDWGFGYAAMGFGALWLGATTLIARGRERTDKRPN